MRGSRTQACTRLLSPLVRALELRPARVHSSALVDVLRAAVALHMRDRSLSRPRRPVEIAVPSPPHRPWPRGNAFHPTALGLTWHALLILPPLVSRGMPSSSYFPWSHVACPPHPTALGTTWQVRRSRALFPHPSTHTSRGYHRRRARTWRGESYRASRPRRASLRSGSRSRLDAWNECTSR